MKLLKGKQKSPDTLGKYGRR